MVGDVVERGNGDSCAEVFLGSVAGENVDCCLLVSMDCGLPSSCLLLLGKDKSRSLAFSRVLMV